MWRAPDGGCFEWLREGQGDLWSAGGGNFVIYGLVKDGEFHESGATNDGSLVPMSEY